MQDERASLDAAIDAAIDDVARSMTEGTPSVALRRAVRSRIGSRVTVASWSRPAFAVGVVVMFAVWMWSREVNVVPPSLAHDINIEAPVDTPPRPLALVEGKRVRTRATARPASSVPVFVPDAPVIDPLTVETLPINALIVENPGVATLEIEPVQIEPLE
jgi:hypothetical protein